MKIPTQVPIPPPPTKTSRHTQPLEKNSIHPLTTNLSNPTSPFDAFDPPQILQRRHRHHR